MIIGILGKKGSGKDTLFELIRDRFPFAQRVAIADPLKRDIAYFFRLTVEDLELRKEEFRPCLQWYGHMNKDRYTALAFEKADSSPSRLVVITDARYPEQVEAIRSRGGLVIRIFRDKIRADDPHPSEAIDEFPYDLSITNPGDREAFREAALPIFAEIARRLA